MIAALSALAGVVVGAGAGGEDAALPAAPPSACARPGPDSLALAAGQKVMVRMGARASDSLRERARAGEIGGVIVFPPLGVSTERLAGEIATLQRAAAEGGNPALLVATDQEGGLVERFPEAPPQLTPQQLADFGTVDDARLEGQATGNFLAELGINTDLAPVLDVPASEDAAIAFRSFGSDPARVTRLGLAFAGGLADERVIAVPKHFPGLGRTELNTDLGPAVIDASRRSLRDDLQPFRTAIADGAAMIMVGLASYPGLGERRPAAFSATVIDELLRGELGFGGVVITDDLLAAGVGDLAPDRAAVEASAAGADIVLFAGGEVGDVAGELARAARGGRLDEADLRASCERVVALKGRLGGRRLVLERG